MLVAYPLQVESSSETRSALETKTKMGIKEAGYENAEESSALSSCAPNKTHLLLDVVTGR